MANDDHAHATVHVRTQAIPLLRGVGGVWFAILTIHGARSSSTSRIDPALLTAFETIALTNDIPATPEEWLPAYLRALRPALGQLPTRRGTTWSACIGLVTHATQDTSLVVVSQCGSIRAVVETETPHGFRTSPIINSESPTTTLTFTEVVEGTLGVHDALIIGTPALFAAIPKSSRDRTSASLATLADQYQQALRDAPNTAGGVFIGQAPSRGRTPPQAHASMENFLETVASTEHFLTPSLGPSLRRLRVELLSALRLFPTPRRPRTEGTSTARSLLAVAVHGIHLFFTTLGVIARSAVAMLADGVRLIIVGIGRLTQFVTTLPKRRSSWSLANLHPRVVARSAREWYEALPRMSQRLLLLAAIFAVLFAGSTVALWRRHATDTDIASFNATVAHIEELQSVAEARLLFGDRAAARGALRDAMAAVATLPRNTTPHRERVALLEREVGASLDRARLLTHITEPLLVTNERLTLPFSPIGDLVSLGNTLVVVAADGHTIARIDPRTGSVATLTLAPVPTLEPPISMIGFDDRSLLLMDLHAHAVMVDSRTGVTTAAAIDGAPSTIRDATISQKRLFLLQPNGSITRHARTAGGFARGALWLDASAETTEAHAFVATGPVFVTHEDGRILAYTSGRRRDVDLTASIDPPFDGPTAITALSNAHILYLGDPRDGRIIAVRDDGVLIGQIQSPAFRNLSRIALDANGESLSILAGSEVYVIAVPK